MSNVIEFPGIGIGPFEISPVAIKNIFGSGRDIAWYGIFVTLGILGGIFYSIWRGQKNNGIKIDDMIDVAIFSIPAAVIGARLYYVLFELDMFQSFYDVIAVWNGGLAIYGGIIFGFVAAFLVCKFKKLSFFSVFDSAAPAIMLGQIIGRWGNFTNAEAYGINTELPWGMAVNQFNPDKITMVHPLFLYESLWNLIGFAVINLIYKKKKFDGQIFLMYITWYGLGRMLIEGIRGDDALTFGSTAIKVSQIVGFLCFVIGLASIFIFALKYKNQKLENEAYESVYSAAAELSDGGSEAGEEIEIETAENIEEADESGESNKTAETGETAGNELNGNNNKNDGDEDDII